MKKKLLPSLTFAGLLSFSTHSQSVVHDVGIEVIDGKEKVSEVLSVNKLEQQPTLDTKQIEFFSRIIMLLEQVEGLSEEEKVDFMILLSNDDFRKEIFEILKDDLVNSNFDTLVRSLLLGLLFGSFFHSHKRKNYGKKDLSSTAGVSFLSTAGIYALSTAFAGFETIGSVAAIGLFSYHFYIRNNLRFGKLHTRKTFDIDVTENKASFLSPFQNFAEPVVAYDKNGNPLLWNKAMEYETGYSFDEIKKYHSEGIDIMDLLYKGDNREKVRKYLESLAGATRGYRNITFTLTTKYGEEKTFVWSLILDDDGSTLRFARQLENLDEIRAKLYETEQKLLRDKLTGAYNSESLQEDFAKKINHVRRKSNYVAVMFDIDNFKSINDKYGHAMGDTVLIELVSYLKAKIRETDKIYRLHGDEFVILFESEFGQEIIQKINKIKSEFFDYSKNIPGLIKNISTSWGITNLPAFDYKNHRRFDLHEILATVDQYMYAVKYFRLISDELIARGVLDSTMSDKNAIGSPRFTLDGMFIGVDVIGCDSQFFLSLEDLALINKRKQELDDDDMRTGEN